MRLVSLAIVIAAGSLCLPSVAQTEVSANVGEWRLASFRWIRATGDEYTGYGIYRGGDKARSIAFRCQDGRLYAIVAARPIVIENYLEDRTQTNRHFKFTVKIGDDEPDTRTWVSMYGGRLFIARGLKLTSRLYRAAAAGRPISIIDRKGEEHRLAQPENRELFDDFLSRCALRERNYPYESVREGDRQVT